MLGTDDFLNRALAQFTFFCWETDDFLNRARLAQFTLCSVASYYTDRPYMSLESSVCAGVWLTG